VPENKSGDLPLDAAADLGHTCEYLDFFKKTILDAPERLPKGEIMDIFSKAYPQCANIAPHFFLETMSNHFAKENFLADKQKSTDPLRDLLSHNRVHQAGSKTTEELEGFVF
jgi:hypothetical protein